MTTKISKLVNNACLWWKKLTFTFFMSLFSGITHFQLPVQPFLIFSFMRNSPNVQKRKVNFGLSFVFVVFVRIECQNNLTSVSFSPQIVLQKQDILSASRPRCHAQGWEDVPCQDKDQALYRQRYSYRLLGSLPRGLKQRKWPTSSKALNSHRKPE